MTPGFLIFIPIIVLFAFFTKNSGLFLHQKRLKSLLTVYITILLASFFIMHMLPEENFLEVNTVSGDTILKEQEATHNLYEAIFEGAPELVEGVHILKQWEFAFSGGQLSIDTDEYANVPVFVKRKEVNDGKIEAVNYATRTIIQRVDVTDGIKPPIIALEGNRLMKIEPEEYRLEIVRFQKEFLTGKLLQDGGQPGNDHISNSVFGANILYVQIPRDVEVLSRPGIIMVDEG
jgi:hypothetical protein